MAQKKTVFISSTFEDLIPHRKKVWELLEGYDVNVRGMERFGARKETSLKTCIAEVEQSDIYIGIISYRLGSIDKKTGKSYTQLEYEKAFDLDDKEIFIYLIDEKNSKVSPQFIDFGAHEKLQSFKNILKDSHTIDSFIDEIDLAEKLKRKFDELLKKKTVEKEIDEYSNSKLIIEKFLLVPKAISGKEIKLKIKFKSAPFPASKSLCSAFSFDYGKTIGAEIEIVKPKINNTSFKNIFIDYNKLDLFWEVQKMKEIEIYAQLQFSEELINNQKANFIEQTFTYYNDIANIFASSGTIHNSIRTETIKAEGHIILRLTDIISKAE